MKLFLIFFVSVFANTEIIHSGDGRNEPEVTTGSDSSGPPQTTTGPSPDSDTTSEGQIIEIESGPCQPNPCSMANTQCVPLAAGSYACSCVDDFEMNEYGNCVQSDYGVTTIETVTVDMGPSTFGPENTVKTTTIKMIEETKSDNISPITTTTPPVLTTASTGAGLQPVSQAMSNPTSTQNPKIITQTTDYTPYSDNLLPTSSSALTKIAFTTILAVILF